MRSGVKVFIVGLAMAVTTATVASCSDADSTAETQAPAETPQSPADTQPTVATEIPTTDAPVDSSASVDSAAPSDSQAPADSVAPEEPTGDGPTLGANSPVLNSGEQLARGQQLVSADGRYRFILQTDGNLVLYGPTGVVWALDRFDITKLVMQADGNLVAYRSDNTAAWSSGTRFSGTHVLDLGNNGNLRVVTNGVEVWSTKTAERGVLIEAAGNAVRVRLVRSPEVNDWRQGVLRAQQDTSNATLFTIIGNCARACAIQYRASSTSAHEAVQPVEPISGVTSGGYLRTVGVSGLQPPMSFPQSALFTTSGDCYSSTGCSIRSVKLAKYVAAELASFGWEYGTLRARSTSVGAWERFRFISAK